MLIKHTLIALALTAAVSGVQAETLEDAWSEALRVSHTLSAQNSLIESAQLKVKSAQSLHLPRLDVTANHLALSADAQLSALPTPAGTVNLPAALTQLQSHRKSTHGYTAGLTLPLFTGGQIYYSVQAAKALLKSAEHMQRSVQIDVKFAVAQSYIQVLQSEQALTVAESYHKSLLAHSKQMAQYAKSGFAGKTEKLTAEVWEKRAHQTLLTARNNLTIARATYNRLLNRPLDAPVTLADLPVPSDSASTLPAENTSEINPKLLSLHSQSAAANALADVKRGSMLPQFFLTGGYIKQSGPYGGDASGWAAGIVMKWSVFDGGLNYHEMSSERIRGQAISAQARELKSELDLRIQETSLRMNELQQQELVALSAQSQAEDNLRKTTLRFRSGLVKQSELLDANTLYNQTRLNVIDVRFGRILLGYQLKALCGLL